MSSVFAKLGLVLPNVESPARYMGGEANSVVKDPAGLLARMALVFPDLYEIGMSNNGVRVLYHVVNREPDLLCEVGFAPWPDMAEQMRAHDIPLYTHASWTPVREFDVLGMSLQTELNFTNVPYVLELAGIAAWAKDRAESDPIVVAGGPSMANPEPVADFFDAFSIGDGEEAVPRMLRVVGEARKAGKSRLEILEAIAQLEGFYVPALAAVQPREDGTLVPVKPALGSYNNTQGVKRQFIPELKKADHPINNLIANMPLVHDRFSVEVMRGCTQGCRFCQAGYWYRPSRELPADDVLDIAKEGLRATGERQLGLLSLSTADYQPIESLTDSIIDDVFFDTVDVSLPSLRVSSFGQTLAGKVAALKGGRSATFAPETGSERLRVMINKTISDQDMYDAAEHAFASGFNKIKLYTMIGLPSENLEDMEAFCQLIEKLVAIGQKHDKKAQINASVGILIPKPFTPLQWAGFMPREQVMDHLRFVRERFYKHRNVKVNWSAWETAHLEAVYSRGDRRLAPLIYTAYQRNMIFESHGEKLDYLGWQHLWDECGYSDEWVYKENGKDEAFPWDYIHAGVTKSYLRSEYEKGFDAAAAPVPNCKWGDCQHCGIPGNGKDTVLATDPVKYKAVSRTPAEIKALVASRRPEAQDGFLYKIVFRKTGISRFLPHQNTLGFFERTLSRLNIPVKSSEGFSPKPRISNTGALPLGLESLCEVISVELLQKLDLSEANYYTLLAEISKPFPRGMEVVSIEPLTDKLSKNMPVTMDYSYVGEYPEGLIALKAAGQLAVVQNHRGVEVDLNVHILELEATPGALHIRAKCNNQGVTVSPYTLYAGLLGTTDDEMRTRTITKTVALY